MITAWRLLKSRHAASAFDGEGARLHGGRWNSPGTRVAYASDSIALAVLEVLAHLQSTAVLQAYAVATLRFPEECIEVLESGDLPARWRRFPSPSANQAIGDQWVTEERSLVLRVPSAIIPAAANFLINPSHPDFIKVEIGPAQRFSFDPRLLSSGEASKRGSG